MLFTQASYLSQKWIMTFGVTFLISTCSAFPQFNNQQNNHNNQVQQTGFPLGAEFDPATSYFPQRVQTGNSIPTGSSSSSHPKSEDDSFLSPPPLEEQQQQQHVPAQNFVPTTTTPTRDSYLNSHFSDNVPPTSTGGPVNVNINGNEYGEIIPAPFQGGVDSYAAYQNFQPK
ncbi:uncharacterized protein LOC110848102 [Folsomia candida]|uniref:uncharacterized protein LOC110848102 n=1 Tax=Folsomia candida TaxID=158441 RepID=UPI000B8F5B34|nr:uncharacterized protein LOC110848102 [Folsomia candida]